MRPASELEQMFGITADRIAEIDEMASRGELPGRATGPATFTAMGAAAGQMDGCCETEPQTQEVTVDGYDIRAKDDATRL